MKNDIDQAMKIKRVTSKVVPEPSPNTFSRYLVVENQVFISGVMGHEVGKSADEESKTALR